MEKQLTEQELKQLKDLQTSYSKIYFEMGELEIRKHSLIEALEKIKEEQNFLYSDLKKIQENETTFAKELNEKYGEGSIDINSGKITSI